MTIREEIEILDLLRQREAEFVRVWQCEDGICRLLGLSAFPFGGPPELPSRIKGKRMVTVAALRRKNAGDRPQAGGLSVKAPAIRKLQNGEDAYRVVYEHRGSSEASFQADGDLLRRLFMVEGDEFRILSIETVRFRTLEDWDSLAVLWQRNESDEDKT